MKRLSTILLPLLLVFLFAYQQNAYGQYTLFINVISNGGVASNNATLYLAGTVGQTAIGVTSNTTFEMSSGFWPAADIVVDVSDDNLGLPTKFKLFNNYPNPFNPATTIKYDIPKSTFVTLKVYNITGQLIGTLVNEQKSAGRYSVSWNAENTSSGVYFYRITAGNFSAVKKGVVLK